MTARQVVQYFNRRGLAASEVEQLSRRGQEVLDDSARGEAVAKYGTR